LALIYPHPGQELAIWKIAAAVVALLAITAGVAILRRRSPYLVTGWLWYLGMLVPMIGLVQVGWQARADRYTYLPQIGLYIMVAWAIRQLAVSRVARRCATVGMVASLAIFAALAYHQTTFWRSDEMLWKHALECSEDNLAAHLHLGTTLNFEGAFPEAIAQYQEAERLVQSEPPNSSTKDAAAAIATNLGSLYWKSGRLDEAIVHYRQAVKIEPRANAYVNLAAVLKERGRLDEAISCCKTALEIDPRNALAYNNLGAALEGQGRLVAAMSYYEKAIALHADYADAQRNLAAIVRQAHETPAAIVRWRDWIELRPKDYVLINNAAWLLATSDDASLRNGPDAVMLARRAIEAIGAREPTTLSTLAAAYAEAGRFAEAVETAQQAAALARQQGNSDLLKSIEEELALYRSHKPYHQPPPAPH
jgi:tetratricopeptide (TPR) repeat protein